MPTLNWIGKEKVINHHLDVPFRVLEKSYTFGGETSENMIIYGDNLMALKSLLSQYESKIKCIYIDPPYNTGNENWVYNDNVNDPRIKKWLGKVVGAESEDLSRHDKWLCMMYPRLKLLHRLLAEDGVIFISIDDNELYNLKMICDEIFDYTNFLLQMTRITKRSGKSTDVFAKNHDYLLIYSKTALFSLNAFDHNDAGFKNKDEYFGERGFYKLNQTLDYDSLQYSSSLDYPLEINGITYYAGTSYDNYLQRQSGNYKRADWAWRWSLKKFQFGYENGFIVVKKSRNGTRIYIKTYQKTDIPMIM
ncbi:MAG: site-specific DNA-methyltransferase [Oscillospiraceae bacterium]|nr:site-specific DNA-methyltransferase [Oscillospiraceae bacterium]